MSTATEELASEQLLDLERILCGVVTGTAWGRAMLDKITEFAMFTDSRHQVLWEVMLGMEEARKPLSRDVLVQELTLTRRLETAGGLDYIRQLPSIYSFEECESYADQLLRHGALRLIQLVGRQLATTKQAESALDALGRAQKQLSTTQQLLVTKPTLTYSTATEEALAQMSYASTQRGGLVGFDCGLRTLNDMLNGIQKQKLYVIAARPSIGKSVVAAHIARSIAHDHRAEGKKVLIVSLEMPASEMVARDISWATQIKGELLGRGWLPSGVTRPAFDEAVKAAIGDTGILFDTEMTHLGEVLSKARRLHAEGKLLALVIDYLQLMTGVGENRTLQIGSITRALKGLAKELDIPVIILSQVSREAEKGTRGDKRPRLPDLRESGDIEQDADVVIMLYRPDFYGDKENGTGTPILGLFEFIIAKHRGGSRGTVIVNHDIECSLLWDKFTDDLDVVTNRPKPLIDIMPRQQNLFTAAGVYDSAADYKNPVLQISSSSLAERQVQHPN
jgi:replicative DNA helicase